MLVVGVEDESAARADALGDEGFDIQDVFNALDAVLPYVVRADVGHNADVRPVVAQAAPDDAASGRLQYRDLHSRVTQDCSCRMRAGRIAFDDPPASDVDAIRRRQPDPLPCLRDG